MSLALTGIASSYRAPITAAEVILGAGPSNAPAGARESIAIGPKSSTGTATVNTVYEIGDEAEAIDLFGPGSPLHRLCRFYLKSNQGSKFYAAAYAATSVGTNAPSTATLTVAGSITGSGTITAYVCEEVITVSYTSTSTATTIGDDLEARINGLTHLPLTANNVTGTVTLTSKIDGTSQNGIYRLRAFYSTAGGATLAASAATLGSGAEGTTTENANLTSLLATLTGSRYYYMGFTNITTADFTTIRGHVATKNEPLKGLRSVAIVGAVGSLSATQTLAIAENSEFLQVVHQRNSAHDPAELVGNVMGVRQKKEQVSAKFNFDSYSGNDWFILPAYSDADWYTSTELNDAVTDGITPINSNRIRSFIVMSVNTRSKNSAGTLDDFRAAETHRLSIMHLLADTLVVNDRLTYANFALRDDERLPDGSVNPNQKIGENVVTPSSYRRWVIGQMTPFFDDELLQGRSQWRDSLIVRIDPLNNSRLQVGLSGRTIDLRHQATFKLNETTPN